MPLDAGNTPENSPLEAPQNHAWPWRKGDETAENHGPFFDIYVKFLGGNL